VAKKKTPLASSIAKEWDVSIAANDLVVLLSDSAPHVYLVLAVYPRMVMEHDLYNSPSLLSKGYKPGDDLPPLVHIRRVRMAPFWDAIPPGHTVDRKVDAFALSKITKEQIRSVMENLVSMMLSIS